MRLHVCRKWMQVHIHTITGSLWNSWIPLMYQHLHSLVIHTVTLMGLDYYRKTYDIYKIKYLPLDLKQIRLTDSNTRGEFKKIHFGNNR